MEKEEEEEEAKFAGPRVPPSPQTRRKRAALRRRSHDAWGCRTRPARPRVAYYYTMRLWERVGTRGRGRGRPRTSRRVTRRRIRRRGWLTPRCRTRGRRRVVRPTRLTPTPLHPAALGLETPPPRQSLRKEARSSSEGRLRPLVFLRLRKAAGGEKVSRMLEGQAAEETASKPRGVQ